MHDIYEKISREDLVGDMTLICNVCGIETVQILMRHLSGLSFYVPKLSRIDPFMKKYLLENNDKSIKQLALELKVSEQHLKRLIRSYKNNN